MQNESFSYAIQAIFQFNLIYTLLFGTGDPTNSFSANSVVLVRKPCVQIFKHAKKEIGGKLTKNRFVFKKIITAKYVYKQACIKRDRNQCRTDDCHTLHSLSIFSFGAETIPLRSVVFQIYR